MNNGFITKALQIILLLLAIGYLAINFITPLPMFLMGENILYAILYTLAFYQIAIKENKRWLIYLTSISAFNMGRVSRTLIEPTGEIPKLSLAHVPLFSVILIVFVLSLLLSLKNLGD